MLKSSEIVFLSNEKMYAASAGLFTSPVILTGHICMPSNRILNRFFSSAYLLKSCQRKTVYFMASTQFHCKYVKLRTTKTLFVLVIYNVIANVLSV